MLFAVLLFSDQLLR